jgi:exonuclease III
VCLDLLSLFLSDVLFNLVANRGRPKGIGAVMHCSLASHMTDCIVPHSGGSECAAAIDGRILNIKVSRPESPHTWHLIGVYQHVARSENKQARISLRESLHSIIKQAREDRNQVVILGDFNAAPPNGRWGYSKWSTAFKEDILMEDWVRTSVLTEISYHEGLSPTWKSSAGMQTAILDRIFVSPANSRSMELSVHWCQPLI